MSVIKKLAVAAASAAAAVIYLAVPANADPGNDPCTLAASFLCAFIPTAPDLDHDVDMTKDFGTDNTNPDAKQPTDICIGGCY